MPDGPRIDERDVGFVNWIAGVDEGDSKFDEAGIKDSEAGCSFFGGKSGSLVSSTTGRGKSGSY